MRFTVVTRGTLLSVVSAALVGFSAPASAGCSASAAYPPAETVSVSDGAVQAGDQESAQAPDCTFGPGSAGEFGVQSTYLRLGAFQATASGGVSVSFSVPASLGNGRHQVVLRGTRDGRPVVVRAAFQVEPATVTGTVLAALPRTGQAFVPMAGTGLLLVLIGAGVVGVARRRRGLIAA